MRWVEEVSNTHGLSWAYNYMVYAATVLVVVLYNASDYTLVFRFENRYTCDRVEVRGGARCVGLLLSVPPCCGIATTMGFGVFVWGTFNNAVTCERASSCSSGGVPCDIGEESHENHSSGLSFSATDRVSVLASTCLTPISLPTVCTPLFCTTTSTTGSLPS